MAKNAISGIGFLLFILGAGCMDSPSILLPIGMIFSGGAMILATNFEK